MNATISVNGRITDAAHASISVFDHGFLYGEGISREGEVIELGVTHRIIEKSGAWYTYGKDRIGQGKDNGREYLKEHPDTAKEIESKIRAVLGVEGGAPAPVEA